MTNQRAKRLLLCATGAFQSYAIPSFVLSLLQNFADDVQVVLSPAAAKMVSRYAVEVATRHPVYVEMTDQGPDVYVPHIELAEWADVVLVYPATTTIMGKIANGIADELVAAIVQATAAPVFFVPIANPRMLEQPAVKRNLARLESDGYVVLAPPAGIEIATREGMAETTIPFPFPTLLVRMSAALASRANSS